MFAGALEPDRRPIHPYRLARDVSALMAESGVLAVDGGETFVWAELARSARRPGATSATATWAVWGRASPSAWRPSWPSPKSGCWS